MTQQELADRIYAARLDRRGLKRDEVAHVTPARCFKAAGRAQQRFDRRKGAMSGAGRRAEKYPPTIPKGDLEDDANSIIQEEPPQGIILITILCAILSWMIQKGLDILWEEHHKEG